MSDDPIVFSGLEWTPGNPEQAMGRASGRSMLLRKERPTHCDFCMLPLPPAPAGGGSSGYGTLAPGGYGKFEREMHACYSCTAWLDAIDMMACKPSERCFGAFYYDDEKRTVTNWPGTLAMPVLYAGSRHPTRNRGQMHQRIYWHGPLGSLWSGSYYTGDAGTLLRNVRRLAKGAR